MKLFLKILFVAAFFTACACTSDNKAEIQKKETIVTYRLKPLGNLSQVGYGNYYGCLAWKLNTEQTTPDTIRLLLISKNIHLMDECAYDSSSSKSVIATFEYQGIHNSDKQTIMDGFMTKNREVWKVTEMKLSE